LLALFCEASYAAKHVNKPYAATSADANSTHPCVGAPAPAQWKHIVVLMFENKGYSKVINGNLTSGNLARYITRMANEECGTAYSGTSGATPKNNWHDANYKVDGTKDGDDVYDHDGSYASKPNYATLTNGLPPSVHGLTNDDYNTTTKVDNIYKQLIAYGKTFKDYYSGSASDTPCKSANFSGAYHDAIRYYIPTIGMENCNSHDVPISPNFMNDVNKGTLPAFSLVLPTNDENMHNNSISSGDIWAENFLTPLFNSAQYKSGDTAVFFLWDEDTAMPNVLMAPSIIAGSEVPAPTGNPISHFAALRTWEDMLGLPMIGNTAQAPSLLLFFNGGGTPRLP